MLPESYARRVEQPAPVAVVPVGEVAPLEALDVAESLRAAGVAAAPELSGRSIRAALKRADRTGVRFVLLIGVEELASERVTLKDLATGEQSMLPRSEVGSRLKELL